jgi:hypothetical protein
VFAYDTGDTRNSYIGRPTTNVSAGYGLYNYNNVPGNVTTAITTTGETYKGAAVYRQTITPVDSTGVAYLTNGNNPGIGVYHSGGGGTGGQYSGHTIFFKPVGPMYSSPIFTAYSNIGGWQSGGDYEDMGDGWFRAKVLWYSASTLSDNKYWAINPSGATTNIPITIYWAGPFKENLNSTTISQFVEGTRSATQGLLPLVGNSSINLSYVSFDSNAKVIFDGTNDYIDVSYYSPVSNTLSQTWEVVVKPTATMTYAGIFGNKIGYGCSYHCNGGIYLWDGNWVFDWFDNSSYQFLYSGVSPTANNTFHIVGVYDAVDQKPRIYVNGQLKATYGSATNMNYGGSTNIIDIGWNSKDGGQHYFGGEIPVTKHYQGKALSAGEVRQNYLHYKTRFNLS